MAANDGFIEYLSPTALADLKKGGDEVLRQIGLIDTLNKKVIGAKTPSGSDSAIKDLNDQLVRQDAQLRKLQQSYNALANTQRAYTSTGKGAAAVSREQSVQQQILRTETDRNIRANTLLGGAYARASAQLLILKREAKDAAIAFGENSKQARTAAEAASSLDNRIKSADKSVGDFQRNVGNYGGAIVGTFQSIFSVVRQLAYILPGIGIAGIFSLALEPLYELIKGTGILSDNMLEARKNTEAYYQTLLNIQVDNREAADSLDALVKTATNARKTDESRTIAVEKLREKYKRFFDQYTDGEIKAGKFGKAVIEINQSLEAQNQINNLETYKKTTDERIQAIRDELKERQKFREEEKYFQVEIQKNTYIQNAGTKAARNALTAEGVLAEKNLATLRKANDERKKSLKDKEDETLLYYSDARLNGVILDFEEKRGRAQERITDATAKALLLEKQKADKKGKEYDPEGAILSARLRYLKELAEANDAQYAAAKTVRENEISELDKLAKDEKRLFKDRIESYGEMLQKRQDLLTDDFTRQQLKLGEQERVDLAESDKALRAELRRAGRNAEAIRKIRQYYSDEQEMILQKSESKKNDAKARYDAEYLKIVDETSKAELEIVVKQRQILESTDKIYRDSQKKMFDSVANNTKLSLEIRQAAFNASLALQRKELDLAKIREKAAAGNDPAKLAEINARYAELNNELNKLAKTSSPFAQSLERSNAALETLKGTLTSGVFAGAGLPSLQKFFDGTFSSVMKGFEMIEDENERMLKQFQYTFVTIAQLAKEAFGFISKFQQENFDAQYKRLEKEKDVAILFAGESTSARAEIERQYEERKRAIQKREAKAAKDTALFSAVIDTASAVVAALPNVALAAVVGILGAAQIALIASQPIPQYAKGTDNAPRGWALVDEKGAEIHTDKHGNVKSTGSDKGANYRFLEAGDKIIPAHQSKALMFNRELNGIMANNGILESKPITQHVGMTAADFDRVLSKNLKKMPTSSINMDKNGITIHLLKQNQKTELLNNRASGKGLIIK